MTDDAQLAWLRSMRMCSQRLAAPGESIASTLDSLLAIQAQEFWGGRWAISLRTCHTPNLSTIDDAFNRGLLARSWTMRGTLHIVLACDLPWILKATSKYQLSSRQSALRSRGIDASMIAQAADIVRDVFAHQPRVTRAQILDAFTSEGLDCTKNKGSLLISTLAIQGSIMQGPVIARKTGLTRDQYFLPIKDTVVNPREPDDPVAELFVRYAIGHGPVTSDDFSWWAGLPKTISRRTAEIAANDARLQVLEKFGETYYLASQLPPHCCQVPDALALPSFDEYFLGYHNRDHACDPRFVTQIGPLSNGIVQPTMLIDKEIRGIWHHSRSAANLATEPSVELFGDGGASINADVSKAFARYAKFLA